MKKRYYIILGITILLLLTSSCNIYKSYTRPNIETQNLFRDSLNAEGDTITLASVGWHQLFLDPQLQKIIEEALANNISIKNSALAIQQEQALYNISKYGYLPSLNIGANASYASGNNKTSKTHNEMLSSSWMIDLFGKVLNAKRAAKAALMESEAYHRAVQTQLIASVANLYYTLLELDEQLAITKQTVANWIKSVETMELLLKAGVVNQAAVVQSRANKFGVEASIPELTRQIRETENALCILLGKPAGAIGRGNLANQHFDVKLTTGIPAQLLAYRPDIQQAESRLMAAYANTNVARAALYPSISINGSYGFSNSIIGAIINPAQLMGSIGGSIVQPIFNQGQLQAELKVTKLQQEIALNNFKNALLNAGSEVSNALYKYQCLSTKISVRSEQIKSLEQSVAITQELLTHSSSTYIEVLTAQQNLLSAQLSRTNDTFLQIQSIIALYAALGGGSK